MDEYWTTSLQPIHHAQQISANSQKKGMTLVDDYSDGDALNDGGQPNVPTRKSAVSVSSAGYSLKRKKAPMPICSSCGNYVAIKGHYFRCPTFLSSGSINDVTSNEKITKHGRYLCKECGYSRMTYLPYLFVYSRCIFTWIYLTIVTILASLIGVKCNILCIDDGTLNNKFHETAYESELFILGIACHFLTPILFILILTTKQIKSREIESKSFKGKVIQYAQKLNWSKVWELIRHEDCDVNEIDRSGRSALLYAAISHNFQVIRELQQFGANMDHVDINSCGIRHYLDTYRQDVDDDDERSDRLTGPTRAAKNGQTEDIHLCMELGCNLNKMDGNGHTPLLIACKEREIGIIKILIHEANTHGVNKVDLNKTDKNGRTAIIISTQYGYDDVLETLLNEGNDVDVVHRDNEGVSAFEHAISCNQKKCAKLIHQYKKKHNIQETELKRKDQQDDNDENSEEIKDNNHVIEQQQNGASESIKNEETKVNDEETQQDVDEQDADFEIVETKEIKTETDVNDAAIISSEVNVETESVKKIRLPLHMTQESSSHIVASDTEGTDDDDNLKGDKRKHPIDASPRSTDMEMGTPSHVVLHESDSIDRRIYRALTVEKMKQVEQERLQQLKQENENNDLYDGDDDDQVIGLPKKKQTISIVITDVDGIDGQINDGQMD